MNPAINTHINVAPVQELMQYMRGVEACTTFTTFCIASAIANTCLQTLKSTSYITQREHYEYQRMLNDICSRKKSEVTA